MRVAYVDSSSLIAVAFNEDAGNAMARSLGGYQRLLSSNLLEAEMRAAFRRENAKFDANLISGIDWVLPQRPLSSEIATALTAGYLRGADLWHMATALYAIGAAGPIALAEFSFVTLDSKQRRIAAALGFQT